MRAFTVNRIGWLMALFAILIAGCAGTPRVPKQCEGPWTPINAPAESQHEA